MDDDELYDTIHSAVRDALAEQPKKNQKNQVVEAAILLCGISLGIAMIDYLSHASWVNRFRYSIWYSVDTTQVKQFQEKPPSDCDFLKAPIGLKGCHYKKQVVVQEPSAENGNKRSVFVYWSKEDADN
jgi:hypothetical protein